MYYSRVERNLRKRPVLAPLPSKDLFKGKTLILLHQAVEIGSLGDGEVRTAITREHMILRAVSAMKLFKTKDGNDMGIGVDVGL